MQVLKVCGVESNVDPQKGSPESMLFLLNYPLQSIFVTLIDEPSTFLKFEYADEVIFDNFYFVFKRKPLSFNFVDQLIKIWL